MRPHKLVSSGRQASLLAAVVVLVWLGVSLPVAAFGPPPNAPLSLEKLARIDEFLNGQVAQGGIPGAIVLIQRHGKPVYFKCFGKRDVDAGIDMTPDAIFPLHSLSKTITSFAAMMLVDRGKIIQKQAYILAFSDTFFLLGIALIVALVAALLLKKPDHLESGGAH